MKLSRQSISLTLLLGALVVTGVVLINMGEAQQQSDTGAASNAATADASAPAAVATDNRDQSQPAPAANAADRFALPQGGPDEQLQFIAKIAKPTEQFTSVEQANAYWKQASAAMKASAERVLAGPNTEQQAFRAVDFKAEALRMQGILGNKNAEKERDEFLDQILKDKRMEIAGLVAPIRFVPKLRHWDELSQAQRTEVMNRLVADIKAAGPTPFQADLLIKVSNSIGDGPDHEFIARAVNELIPVFKNGKGPEFAQIVPVLEGTARRLNLPGNKIELAGTTIDGKPFDWESYRGKVVLIDFWATWCPECLNEIPNVLENYKQFHDKGFEVVGVCMDADAAQAQRVMRQVGMTWQQLFPTNAQERGWEHPIARQYGIMAIPRMILVDREGKVVNMMAYGPILHQELEKLLGPTGAATSVTGSRTSQLGAPESPAATAR